MNESIVVTTPEDFVPHLRDGDVILLDKLSPFSRLVQFGDNRPAGHVGVWFEDGIYEAALKQTPDGSKLGGVWHTPFSEVMALQASDGRGQVAMVRTVTALRHHAISDEKRRVMEGYLADCTDHGYGFLDAALLAPFAFDRVSGGRAPSSQMALIQAWAYLAKKQSTASKGATKMFCSQLVYRAYEQAGLRIEVKDPLYTRYHRRPHLPLFRRPKFGDDVASLAGSVRFPLGLDDLEETDPLSEYDSFFETDVLPELAESSASDRQDPIEESDLSGRARIFKGSNGATASIVGDTRTAERRPQLGDMVTPGDFWSSPSFDLIAVIHRPAGF